MKKKMVQKIGWATAQLCHNTMRNCIVTQQVLGSAKWLLSVSQYNHCIVTGSRLGWLRYWVTIHGLYCDQEGFEKGILYRDKQAGLVAEECVSQYTEVDCDQGNKR